MVDHFYSLGICQAPAMRTITAGGGLHPLIKTNMSFSFTDLGRDFLEAVTRRNIESDEKHS